MIDNIKADSDTPTAALDRVRGQHPEWSSSIASFEKAREQECKLVSKIIEADVAPAHLRRFRLARCRPMEESAARNVDEQETRAKAKHAPTTTDIVEGGFGTLDQALHKTSASMHAVFGIAMARRTHMLQSQTEIKEKMRPSRMKKLKQID